MPTIATNFKLILFILIKKLIKIATSTEAITKRVSSIEKLISSHV